MKDSEQPFLSTRQMGTLLGVTRQTIRNWINKGHIRAFHVGQNYKIPAREAGRLLTGYGLPVPDWLEIGQGTPSEPAAERPAMHGGPVGWTKGSSGNV
ncbi:MAG: helix-turn-helix domain-containing protein [Deltaproteobacteria bacterium]|nr:helix-turn-helix domain-containing protein [Deltaproteobacteria bacterium]